MLGLDRCPEVKTLRRKIKLLAHAEQTVRDWQAALARAWHDADQDLYATLAVDGHVKVYAGRKGKLAKHFIARQKLCLPASASYWINALGGKPLLCVHKPLDPKMVKALEHDIVPQLEALGVLPEHAPDLTVPNSGAPALTLVFDREGWSPAVFRRLARRGLAVITWHKNFKGPPWPESDFREVDTPLFGPAHTHASRVVLAEKPVELSNALTVRQIRRRLDNGRQVALITTQGRTGGASSPGERRTRCRSGRGRFGSSCVRMRLAKAEAFSHTGTRSRGPIDRNRTWARACVEGESFSDENRDAPDRGELHRRLRTGWSARRGRGDRHRTGHGPGHVPLGEDERPGGPPRASEAEPPSFASDRRGIERDGPGDPQASVRAGNDSRRPLLAEQRGRERVRRGWRDRARDRTNR